MKKLYKLTCSNCNKSLGTLLIEDGCSISPFPFLLQNDVYEGEIKSLSIRNDITYPVYCFDCANMGGKENDT